METLSMGQVPPEQAERKKYIVELRTYGSITVEETTPGTFKVVDNTLTTKGGNQLTDETAFAFKNWDSSVQDLDDGESDVSRQFKMSLHLQHGDVELTPDTIKAPSLKELQKTLQHVDIFAYCPGDL